MFSATEIQDRIKLLVYYCDPAVECVARMGNDYWGTVEQNRTTIEVVDSHENLYERRLSGAVFAHQRMDLTAAHVERNFVEHSHAGKLFEIPASRSTGASLSMSRGATG